MKHLKTFEAFTNNVNEGVSSKAKALQSKFEDCQLVSDWYQDMLDDDMDLSNTDAAMKEFGTKPDNTLYASAANDEDAFEDFMKEVKKSGLKYKEADNVDGFKEVFISGK